MTESEGAGAGRPEHVPTQPVRNLVENAAAMGVRQDSIADLVGISAPTLRKWYREELTNGKTKAVMKVANQLFADCTNPNYNGRTLAQIFFLKTQAGWKEPVQEHKHSGTVGSYDLTKVPTDQLEHLIAILGPAAVAGEDADGTGEAEG